MASPWRKTTLMCGATAYLSHRLQPDNVQPYNEYRLYRLASVFGVLENCSDPVTSVFYLMTA